MRAKEAQEVRLNRSARQRVDHTPTAVLSFTSPMDHIKFSHVALQGYRAEVRRTFEATERIFAADMKWRDEWVEGRKKGRRDERRKAKQSLKAGEEEPAGGQEERAINSGRRIFPEDKEESRTNSSPVTAVAPITEDGGGSARAGAAHAEGDTRSGRRVLAEEDGRHSSTRLSGAERHHNPEVDEGLRDEEEGLLARPLGKQATGSDPEVLRGESIGTPSPGARRRSTRSDGRRRGTSGNLEAFAGAEEGLGGGVERASGQDRTRGPCQGSGFLGVSRQGLEKQCCEDSFGAGPPPSVSDMGATRGGASSLLVPVPGQEAGEIVESDGSPGRAERRPDRAD